MKKNLRNGNTLYWESKKKKPNMISKYVVVIFDWKDRSLEKTEYHFETLEEAKSFVSSKEEGDIKIYNNVNQVIHSEKKYAKIKDKKKDDDNPYT
jgi:hypothetical protein